MRSCRVAGRVVIVCVPSEGQDADEAQSGENVFAMMRRIGQAKSGLAALFATDGVKKSLSFFRRV